jgi:hypothetical protein
MPDAQSLETPGERARRQMPGVTSNGSRTRSTDHMKGGIQRMAKKAKGGKKKAGAKKR